MYNKHTVEQALQKIAESEKKTYGVLRNHGTLELGYYKPIGTDPQDPHDQDEIYIVQSGSGHFVVENDRQPFKAGDALFVPAFVAHRFEDFSDDFAAWVVFYGPRGGE